MSIPIFPESSQHDQIQAEPKKPRRNRKSARDAGARFARIIAEHMATALGDDRIERRVPNGAKDRGDIGGVRTIMGARFVIECKDRAQLNLSGWLREAAVEAAHDDAPHGVVVHKRAGKADPAEQYVTMTLETLLWLLLGGPDNLRGV